MAIVRRQPPEDVANFAGDAAESAGIGAAPVEANEAADVSRIDRS